MNNEINRWNKRYEEIKQEKQKIEKVLTTINLEMQIFIK